MNHEYLRQSLAARQSRRWQPSYALLGSLAVRTEALATTTDMQILATLFGLPKPPSGSAFEQSLLLLRDAHVSAARLTKEVIENAAR
jgi:hypothetical protein